MSPSRVSPANPFVEFDRANLDRTIPAVFADQARRHAARVAVRTPAAALTYAELDAASDEVAAALRTGDGAAGRTAGILLELGASFGVALLGVWKAGRVCVLLDPTAPPARLRAILADSGADGLVSGGLALDHARTLLAAGSLLVDVDRPRAPATTSPPRPLAADDPACLVYTSGSTGAPKGVVQSHRNLLHQVMIYANEKRLGPDDRTAFAASPGAIYATWTIVTSLLTGGSVYPLPRTGLDEVLDWIAREEMTIVGGGRALVRHPDASPGNAARPIPSVRMVSFGGEAVYRSDVEAAWRLFPSARVRVGLGTTETGALTRNLLERGTPISSQTIPVGYPYPDKTVLVLAEDGTELGPGEAGEIAVRSRYLAAGYFRRPDLTAAAFEPVPGAPGERLYRTGDLGMWRPDGCLVHLGRKDFQVKIRGFRVDTAEVEGTLLGVPGIRDAAVVTREDTPGEIRLVAYVVPVEPPGPSVSALRRAVTVSCPPHMQPSAFVTLPALPVTTGRKLDRSALPRPAPTRPVLDTPYVPPRTPVEATLAAIWADVLGLETVGVLDSFGDLGGHSLVAMRLAARVAEAFRVTIPLAELLEAATVEAMAVRVVDALAAAMEPEALARLLAEAEQEPEALGRAPDSS